MSEQLIAAVKRMLADLREIESTGMCGRTRLQQIIDLDESLRRVTCRVKP